MSTLLETQRAMRTWLVEGERNAAADLLADGISADRLDIYRNTFVANATRALRLTYPAVRKLVGDEFFEGAAAAFIAQHPPRSACLDHYGEAFVAFLAAFPPAALLFYLADVARLAWAVSRAIHADDVEPLDLARLVALSPGEQVRVAFVPHPSVSLLTLATPADTIWRAVLAGDDAALAAVDPAAGAVRLLVERGAGGPEVARLDAAAWHFAAELCCGFPLGIVLAELSDGSAEKAFSAHLAAGRFIDFRLAPPELMASLAPSKAVP
jgi:Putative DNA-binding domain